MLLLAVVAACSSRHPGTPRQVPAQPPEVVPEVAAEVIAEAEPASVLAARCTAAAAAAAAESDELDEPWSSPAQRAIASFAKLPPAGTCDIRRRDPLEATLAALPAPAPAAVNAARAWDRRSPLQYRELVRGALALTPTEEAQLARDGLVVPARLAYRDYTSAYYDIHRAQLPVFVSVDSILHSVFASHDELMAGIEQSRLIAELDAALGAMHCGLAAAAADYPREVARDLDLYLVVARRLLAGSDVPAALGGATATAAAALVTRIEEAGGGGTVELFGRRRTFDASQYAPRGHYAGATDLERYFRAAMWLSRAEFNLVSRDSRSSQPGDAPDPSETPREAVLALALADLAARTGAMPHLDRLDGAWAAFAGKREDVSLADLAALRATAGITKLTQPDAADRLRAAIGNRYARTVGTHPMPSVSRWPVIATVLGPRVSPDTAALDKIARGRTADLQPAELGFMLGHDRALAHLPADPAHVTRMRAARDRLMQAPLGDDLYGSWLGAIRTLAARPAGALPAFMDGAAYQDLRLDTALAAYGQLRHNYVLVAAAMYEGGGCEIPDGYVEPAVDTYAALAAYAERGRRVFAELDPKDLAGGAAYFARLGKLMQVLVALSREELANRPLSADAKRFLSMIVERRQYDQLGYEGTFPVALYDGWYVDLFPRVEQAMKASSFIADYATYDRGDVAGIHYLGAHGPRMGVFAVDTGGGPRMMVGPVATAFGHHGPLESRLGDDLADTVAGTAPWAASYTAAAAPEPALTVQYRRSDPRTDARRARRYKGRVDPLPINTVQLDAGAVPLGPVTIDLLDHHFVKLRSLTVTAGAGVTNVPVPGGLRAAVEALRVRTPSGFSGRVQVSLDGTAYERFGPQAPADE